MWEQAREFEAVTLKALDMDTEIAANAALVQTIRKDQANLQSKLEVADSTVHLIWEQQEALGDLLSGLQESFELAPLLVEGERHSRSERRAASLETQLEELSRQVRALADEAAVFKAVQYSRPLERVAHVLDAHSSELDSVQERIDAAERRLRALGIHS